MSKPFRTGPSARRPRVAGLRKRASQPEENQQTENDAVTESQPVESAPSTDQTPAETGTGADDETTTTPVQDEVVSDQAESETAEASGTPSPEPPDTAAPVAESSSEPSTEAFSAAKPVSASGVSSTADLPASEDLGQGGTAANETTKAEAASNEPDSAKNDTRILTVLGALVVVFVVLAAWFGLQASALSGDGAGSNEALVDSAATSEVNGQISDAVTKVFSYDFNDTAKTEKAANELLVGEAVGKYNQLFATVKQQAPAQKLIVTTKVKASAVNVLQDDRAEVLLFVDQNAVRGDSGENNVGPAQILVGAEKHGDQWKISQITQR